MKIYHVKIELNSVYDIDGISFEKAKSNQIERYYNPANMLDSVREKFSVLKESGYKMIRVLTPGNHNVSFWKYGNASWAKLSVLCIEI